MRCQGKLASPKNLKKRFGVSQTWGPQRMSTNCLCTRTFRAPQGSGEKAIPERLKIQQRSSNTPEMPSEHFLEFLSKWLPEGTQKAFGKPDALKSCGVPRDLICRKMNRFYLQLLILTELRRSKYATERGLFKCTKRFFFSEVVQRLQVLLG